jgi:flavodoxin I
MVKIGIFYGSSTGNTEKIADLIRNAFGSENATTINVEDADPKDLEKFPYLIFGTSTWGIGDLQDDWDDFIEVVENADLSGKKVALFGLGDQEIYTDSFADGVAKIYRRIAGKTTIVGSWPNQDYLFDESEALKDGKFVGLIIDEDNQTKLTVQRVTSWVEGLKKEFV